MSIYSERNGKEKAKTMYFSKVFYLQINHLSGHQMRPVKEFFY